MKPIVCRREQNPHIHYFLLLKSATETNNLRTVLVGQLRAKLRAKLKAANAVAIDVRVRCRGSCLNSTAVHVVCALNVSLRLPWQAGPGSHGGSVDQTAFQLSSSIISMRLMASTLSISSFHVSRAQLLRHSSRSASLASADRYSAIRKFFTSSYAFPSISRTSFQGHRIVLRHSSAKRVETGIWSSCSKRTSMHVDTRLYSRSFHSSWLYRQQRPPKDPIRHPLNTAQSAASQSKDTATSNTTSGEPHSELPPNLEHYPRFFRRLARTLPHVRRPTQEDFLRAANGFVQRMRVRIRWFFLRAFRKFNADDISAFVTWFLMSQGLWILVGT